MDGSSHHNKIRDAILQSILDHSKK